MLLAPGLSHQRADCGRHPLGLSCPMLMTSCGGHCCSQLCSVVAVRPAAPGCRATHQAGDVVEARVGVGVHDAQGAQVREPRLLVGQDRRPLRFVGVCSAPGTQCMSGQSLRSCSTNEWWLAAGALGRHQLVWRRFPQGHAASHLVLQGTAQRECSRRMASVPAAPRGPEQPAHSACSPPPLLRRLAAQSRAPACSSPVPLAAARTCSLRLA
jgi:hypothetical protein